MPIIRLAQQKDLGSIVTLLVDDPLDSKREDPILPAVVEYQEAFRAITHILRFYRLKLVAEEGLEPPTRGL